MIVSYLAKHKDGHTHVVTFEKPSGCHPTSPFAGEFAAGVANGIYPASPCVKITYEKLAQDEVEPPVVWEA